MISKPISRMTSEVIKNMVVLAHENRNKSNNNYLSTWSFYAPQKKLFLEDYSRVIQLRSNQPRVIDSAHTKIKSRDFNILFHAMLL